MSLLSRNLVLIPLLLALLPEVHGRQVIVQNASELLSELQAWTGEEGEAIDLFLPAGTISFQGVPWRPGGASIRNGTLSVIGCAPPQGSTVLDVAARRPGRWPALQARQCYHLAAGSAGPPHRPPLPLNCFPIPYAAIRDVGGTATLQLHNLTIING